MKYTARIIALFLLVCATAAVSSGCREEEAVAPEAAPVAMPSFSPPAGTYEESIEVSIECSTPGTEIWYSTNGIDPGYSVHRFDPSNPIELNTKETTTIKARAYKEGMERSDIATAIYSIDPEDVATPVIWPAGGAYTQELQVTISCATEGAEIRYTLDGTYPGEMSTLYTESTIILVAEDMTIKARGYHEGMDPSDIATAVYDIELPRVEAPVLNPPPGAFSGGLEVSITCGTEGASIFYTVDGSNPTIYSIPYTGEVPIAVIKSTKIKARAFKSGMSPSPVTEGVYLVLPGIMAYYPFDGDANDWSPNGNDGILYGPVPTEDRHGNPGCAFAFDGLDDYIELSNEENFDLRIFTAIFIVKMNELPKATESQAGRYAILTKGGLYGNYYISFIRSYNMSYAQLSYAHDTSSGSTQSYTHTVPVSAGIYYHIAIVKELDSMHFFVNGEMGSTSSWMYTPELNDEPALIGMSSAPTSPHRFTGVIDDVKIFDRALTSSEIYYLYQAEM